LPLIKEPQITELRKNVINFENNYLKTDVQKLTLHKMIEAFLLLNEITKQCQSEFIFRGGTCLPLVLQTEYNRFSTDLDFIVTDREQFARDLNKIKKADIIRELTVSESNKPWVLLQTASIDNIFQSGKGTIPLHSTIYKSSEVLRFDTQKSPIIIPFPDLRVEFDEMVVTPTRNSLLVDKLLTLSKNTVGYKEDEYSSRFKQVYDCGLLFDNFVGLDNLFLNFQEHFNFKLQTMGISNRYEELFTDLTQSLISFVMLGLKNLPNHNLSTDCQNLKSRALAIFKQYIYSSPYPNERQLFSIFGSKLLILVHIFNLLHLETLSINEGEKLVQIIKDLLKNLKNLSSSERNTELRQTKRALGINPKFHSSLWCSCFPLTNFDNLGLETIKLLEIYFDLKR